MNTFFVLDDVYDVVGEHSVYEDALADARHYTEESEQECYVVFVAAVTQPVPTEVEVTEYEWSWL